MQRFFLTAAECGGAQFRNRRFQFGARDGVPISCDRQVTHGRALERACLAGEGQNLQHRNFGKIKLRREWADFCALQGLPRTFELPGLGRGARYRAVGNGVPVYMAAVTARAIKTRHASHAVTLCRCGCGRGVTGKAVMATAACRKRLERARRRPDVTELTRLVAGASRAV